MPARLMAQIGGRHADASPVPGPPMMQIGMPAPVSASSQPIFMQASEPALSRYLHLCRSRRRRRCRRAFTWYAARHRTPAGAGGPCRCIRRPCQLGPCGSCGGGRRSAVACAAASPAAPVAAADGVPEAKARGGSGRAPGTKVPRWSRAGDERLKELVKLHGDRAPVGRKLEGGRSATAIEQHYNILIERRRAGLPLGCPETASPSTSSTTRPRPFGRMR